MTIDATGSVGIGTTAPTGGFDSWAATNYFSDAQVAHGMTTLAPTTAYGAMVPYSGTQGGFIVRGLADGDAATLTALQLDGMHGHASPTQTVMDLRVGKANGTGWQALAASEIAIQFTNYTTKMVTVLGSGNVGIGVVPEAWGAAYTALQISPEMGLSSAANESSILQNAYYDTTNSRWERIGNGYASAHTMQSGIHYLQVATCAAADSAISWITGFKVTNTGAVANPVDNAGFYTGVGDDLEMSSDGSNAQLFAPNGNMVIRGSTGMYLQSTTGENLISAVPNGATTLFYDNVAKLATTATGASITGTAAGLNLLVSDAAAVTYTANTIGAFQNTSAGTGAISRVAIVGGTAGYSVLDFGDSGASNAGGLTYNHSTNALAIATGGAGATMITIDSAGDVGIGTTAPNAASFGAGVKVLSIEGVTTADFGAIEMTSTCAGTAGRLGDVRFVNKNGTGSLVAQAGIRGISDGAVDSTALAFYTEVTGGSLAEKMKIDSVGRVTTPSQPWFLVWHNSGYPLTARTGDGTNYNVCFNCTICDNGSNWNGTCFIAPVAGVYAFSSRVDFSGLTSSMDYMYNQILTSNVTHSVYGGPWQQATGGSNGCVLTGVVSVAATYMDAGDVALVMTAISGGSKTVSFLPGNYATNFQGFLIG